MVVFIVLEEAGCAVFQPIKEKQGLCRHPAGAVTGELIIHRDTYLICITSTQFVSKSRLQVQRELKDS